MSVFHMMFCPNETDVNSPISRHGTGSLIPRTACQVPTKVLPPTDSVRCMNELALT